MKIGFVSLPVAGHLNPMMALARGLQARGHDVASDVIERAFEISAPRQRRVSRL